MSEIRRIEDQLQRALEGEAWHGPAILETLEGVDAWLAAARPIENAHSIWEITLHITAWQEIVRERIAGKDPTITDERDWPPVRDTSPATWKAAVDRVAASNRELRAAVTALGEDDLERTTSKGVTYYVLLHGVVQHGLYHAGQIALLRKVPVGARSGAGGS